MGMCSGLLRSPSCASSLAAVRCSAHQLRGPFDRAVRACAAATADRVDSAPQRPTVPFRASIDFKYIVDNVEELQKNAENRFSTAEPQQVAQLYAQFTELGRDTDKLRKERNDNAKAMQVRRTLAAPT